MKFFSAAVLGFCGAGAATAASKALPLARKRTQARAQMARPLTKGPQEFNQASALEDPLVRHLNEAEGEMSMSMPMEAASQEGGSLPATCAPEDYKDFNDVLDCLSRIKENEKTWIDRRECTINIINEQIGGLYTSAPILRNNIDTDFELDECYDFPIHEYNLASDIDDWLFDLSDEESIGTFVAKAHAQFVCFNDAHTGFYPPLLLGMTAFPPIGIRVTLDEDGKQAFYVNGEGLSVISSDWHTESGIDLGDYDGKKIESINGVPPLDYYLKVVECNGQHNDIGVRFNDFVMQSLQQISGYFVRFVEDGLPDNGSFNVVFDDGTSLDTRWGVSTSNLPTSLDEMAALLVAVDDEKAEYFDFLEDQNITTICTEQVLSSPSLYEGLDISPKPVRALQEDGDETGDDVSPECMDVFYDDEGELVDLSTRDSGTDMCHFNEAINATTCLICVATKGEGKVGVLKVTTEEKSVMIYKMDGFMVDLLDSNDWLKALDVAAKLAQIETKNEELIIDQIGNGGGIVIAANVMNDYLFRGNPGAPSFSSPIDSFEW
ncbi:hypothetical protein ACHAWF_010597 [Thalassiosira exigua]